MIYSDIDMRGFLHYFICRSHLFLSIFYISVTAIATNGPDDLGEDNENVSGSSSGSGLNQATVMLSNHDPINLFLDPDPDGSLTHFEFPSPIDIVDAIVLSPVTAKCFFWRRRERFNDVYEYPFVSSVFSSTGPSSMMDMYEVDAFTKAERLYCYDGSQEEADGDTFTLFFETEAADAALTAGKLIRLRMSPDQDIVELSPSMIARYPEIRVGTKAKLIHPRPIHPTLEEEAEAESGADFILELLSEEIPGCVFFRDGPGEDPLLSLTDEFYDIQHEDTGKLSRIICLRDAPSWRRIWQREGLSGEVEY